MRPRISAQSTSRLLLEFEKANEEPVSKEQDLSIAQEIECPRCHDVMTLCSEFDRLGYFCEECSFSLHLSHRKCGLLFFISRSRLDLILYGILTISEYWTRVIDVKASKNSNNKNSTIQYLYLRIAADSKRALFKYSYTFNISSSVIP